MRKLLIALVAVAVAGPAYAQDFINVLTSILGNADLATHVLPRDHRAQRSLGHILQAGARAADLIRRVLMFSRREEPQRTIVKLPAVVQEVVQRRVD